MANENADDVVKALISLDPKNDEHWNEDGLPRLDQVSKLAGRNVKRSEVTDADPTFNRAKAQGIEPVKAAEQPSTAKAGDHVPAVEGATPTVAPDAPQLPPQDEVQAKHSKLSDLITELEGELAEKEAVIAKAKLEVTNGERERDAVNHQLSQLLVQRDNLPGHQANTKQIMDYIAGQNRIRLERHERNMELRRIGFNVKDLQPKSPLDAAMARKNTRGTARPTLAATVSR
jgi:hypothetical protein